MKKVLKNLLLGAVVVTVGAAVYSIVKNKQEQSAKKSDGSPIAVSTPVHANQNDTAEFVKRRKERVAAKRAERIVYANETSAEQTTEVFPEEAVPVNDSPKELQIDLEISKEDENPENEN